MHVLAISLGRNILKEGSRERLRMREYATRLDSLHVVILSRTIHGFPKEVHDDNLHLYPTNTRSRLGMLLRAFTFGRKIIGKNGLGFVVTSQDPLEIGWMCYVLSCLQGTRLHIQVHGDYFSSDAWIGGSILRRIHRFFALILLRRAPSIRVVSQRIKESLIARNIMPERITVLPIRPELENFLAKSRHLTHGDEECMFVTVGRLAPEKDIGRILRAFAIVVAQYPKVRLQIVGEGTEKEDLEHLITELELGNQVTLSPWTEDIADVLSTADVFLLASRHEAYALTLIEAMAVGLSIVTTDVGCVGEVVQDQLHGIVVREESVTSYAEAMKIMIVDSIFREQCGKRSKMTAQEIAQTSATEYTQAWVNTISKF